MLCCFTLSASSCKYLALHFSPSYPYLWYFVFFCPHPLLSTFCSTSSPTSPLQPYTSLPALPPPEFKNAMPLSFSLELFMINLWPFLLLFTYKCTFYNIPLFITDFQQFEHIVFYLVLACLWFTELLWFEFHRYYPVRNILALLLSAHPFLESQTQSVPWCISAAFENELALLILAVALSSLYSYTVSPGHD